MVRLHIVFDSPDAACREYVRTTPSFEALTLSRKTAPKIPMS